jgi:hypothetical protein
MKTAADYLKHHIQCVHIELNWFCNIKITTITASHLLMFASCFMGFI